MLCCNPKHAEAAVNGRPNDERWHTRAATASSLGSSAAVALPSTIPAELGCWEQCA